MSGKRKREESPEPESSSKDNRKKKVVFQWKLDLIIVFLEITAVSATWWWNRQKDEGTCGLYRRVRRQVVKEKWIIDCNNIQRGPPPQWSLYSLAAEERSTWLLRADQGKKSTCMCDFYAKAFRDPSMCPKYAIEFVQRNIEASTIWRKILIRCAKMHSNTISRDRWFDFSKIS